MGFLKFALLSALFLILGFGASSPERSVDVALKVPAQTLEYGHRVILHVQAAMIESRADTGDPCAQIESAWNHAPNTYRDPLTRNGRMYGRDNTWYTGINPDSTIVRERLQAALAVGGCPGLPYPVYLVDTLLRDRADATLHQAAETLAAPSATPEDARAAMALYDPDRHPILYANVSGINIFYDVVGIADRQCDPDLYADALRFVHRLPAIGPEPWTFFVGDAPPRMTGCTS